MDLSHFMMAREEAFVLCLTLIFSGMLKGLIRGSTREIKYEMFENSIQNITMLCVDFW